MHQHSQLGFSFLNHKGVSVSDKVSLLVVLGD